MFDDFKAHPAGWAFIFVVLIVAGCAPSSETRRGFAEQIAQDAGFTRQVWSGLLPIVTYHRFRARADTLDIYIEGDGYAFASRRQPSADPTPINPLALKLALGSGAQAVAYLGRPCQYITQAEAQQCDPIYWTSHRFSPEVVEAVQQVINQLKGQAGVSHITLTGYSGGGVIAALVAAQREDVSHLTTVASPLSVEAWLAYHHLSPLMGGDPLDQVDQLCAVPQTHYWGADDEVVPVSSVEPFIAAVTHCRNTHIEILPDADHRCCWVRELSTNPMRPEE